MNTNRFCVLVYNPISNHGHLDSWNAMFVSLLLKKGWRVLALTPDAPALISRLAQKDAIISQELEVLDWNAWAKGFNKQALRMKIRQAWQIWNFYGDKYFYHRQGSETTSDMAFATWLKTKLLQLFVPTLFRASHFFYARYLHRRKYKNNIDTDNIDPEEDLYSPSEFALRVRAATKKSKWKPSLIFNMYLDIYKSDAGSWNEFAALNGLPWTGIRFVPTERPVEGYYALASLKGVCFLDEEVCQTYRNILPDKSFEVMPDIADATLPGKQSELSQEILRRAAGRKIVFLGGSIGGQKNLSCWYELIGLADAREWFFVQIGELHKGTFTSEDREMYGRIVTSPPENLFLKTEYLPDERAFNEVIAASDVIFAVYRNFRISSNMLCKAALFKKPILVSDRYLVGQRVQRYGIGLAVREDEAASVFKGLLNLKTPPIPAENFLAFQRDFNEDILGMRLDHFLKDCLHMEVQ